jgi:hypothetical protein
VKLITKAARQQLEENFRETERGLDPMDLWPVVKLFNPAGAATWLLAYTVPDQPEVAWGLADLGLGSPETGDIYLPELYLFRGRFNLGIERDLHFEADKSIREYLEETRRNGFLRA